MDNLFTPLSELLQTATLNEKGELVIAPAPGEGKCLVLATIGNTIGVQVREIQN
jgi:hypothetical protein